MNWSQGKIWKRFEYFLALSPVVFLQTWRIRRINTGFYINFSFLNSSNFGNISAMCGKLVHSIRLKFSNCRMRWETGETWKVYSSCGMKTDFCYYVCSSLSLTTPPAAMWMRTLFLTPRLEQWKSIKYAVRYVIGSAAASSKLMLSGITKHKLAAIQVYSDQAPSVVKQVIREPT